MQKYVSPLSRFTKFTIYLTEDTMNLLKSHSIQIGEPVSSAARRLIVHALTQETAKENANVIAAIGREITKDIESVIRKESDRLARLTIRTMKAAAASMYLAAQAAGDTEAESRELLDDALGMSAKYIKVPYSLPNAEEGDTTPATAGASEQQESCGISDEELFDL
jgi:hypothetical protein